MNKHYIYTLTDPNDGKVKYVGQGKNKRYANWLRAKPEWEFKYGVYPWLWSLKKHDQEPTVNIVVEGLTQKQVDAWEIGLIDLIGRKCKGTGPLLNIADGGAGACGVKQSAEHIRKKMEARGFKTLEEIVSKAKGLAKANGGRLQGMKWLRKNGHWDIAGAIKKHPEAFAGIDQIRKCKSLEESVAKAKEMAKANGGKLQNSRWLRDNGHWDIVKAMQNHPDAFEGIDQERKYKPLEETVIKTRELAKANGGKLQNYQWLNDNGHHDVYHAMQKHPEAFVGIDQERKRR